MELYINNTLVDLEKRVPFPLTFQIGDIRDIEKRRGNRSKTIALPGTRNNTKLFKSVFNLSTAGVEEVGNPFVYDFDPSIKIPARYYENGLLIFSGVAQLTECVKKNQTWVFNVVLLSNEIDYLSNFKNIKIRELDFTEYDHTLTYANQQDSWSGTIQKNAVPYSNVTAGQWLGEGYYYGLIDYGYDRPGQPTTQDNFEVTNIPPQVFLKSILDKLFLEAGVSYTSTFFGTQLFKKCLMAFEGGNLPQISAADALDMSAQTDSLTTTFIADAGAAVCTELSFNETVSTTTEDWSWRTAQTQTSNNYNSDSATDVDPSGIIQDHIPLLFVTANQGDYELNLVGDHVLTADAFYKYRDHATVTALRDFTLTAWVDIYVDGGLMVTDQIYLYNTYPTVASNIDTGDYREITMDTINPTISFDYTKALNLNVSASISVKIRTEYHYNIDITGSYVVGLDPMNVSGTYDIDLVTSGVELDLNYQPQLMQAGNNVTLRQFLPKMDGATFFKGLVNMFNLYVQTDPADNTNLLIEPLNTFYNGSDNALNWTQKLDPEQPIKVTPTINFSSKEYLFGFQDDKDYWNERYFSDVTEQYGSKRLDSSSQFATGKTEIKLPFSNKLLGEIPDTNLTVPRNFTVKTDQSGVSEITPKKGKPFIVQIKAGNVITGDNMQTGDWNHIDETDTDNIQTEYPYVGHIDDIDSPSFDLMFGLPDYVFYDIPAGMTYTTNNLYIYHEKFIKEILDKNGKMLTAYMNLTPTDINQLDFGDLINIHGVVYRLNKIENYDSKEQKSTKCEFIKIIEGESIQTNTITELTPGLENFDPYEIPSNANKRITTDGDKRTDTDNNFRVIN